MIILSKKETRECGWGLGKKVKETFLLHEDLKDCSEIYITFTR